MSKLDYTEETRLPNSINHHVRHFYQSEGINPSFYCLDRTLDGVPPFFSFYALHFDPRKDSGIPTLIPVNGNEYWGNGISWQAAEKVIEPIIESDGK